MRKNDLIKLLNDIEGNPDVVLWNGLVEDYMHIQKPEKITFRRMSIKQLLNFINYKRENYDKPEMTIAEIKNEIANGRIAKPAYELTDYNEMYDECKSMIVLQGKLRNKTCHDRIGRIHY